jgi:VWFA-related protein
MRSCLSNAKTTAGVVLICVAAVAAAGQTNPSATVQASTPPTQAAVPNSSETVLHAHANLVLVDVVVADRNKPIHGLDRSKFHVFEDGREQTITSFDEHLGSTQGTVVPNVVKLPPNTFSNAPVYPDSGVVNVLLLDGLNTPVVNQMDVRRQMIEYMGKIQPGTSLAIFTLASRLRLVQGFTTDAARLVKALQGSRAGPQGSPLLETVNDASADQLIDTMTEARSSQDSIASMQQFLADSAAFQTDLRVHMTLDALQEIGRYLSAIPGRKNLVWFSGSFPIALDPDSTLKSPFQAMRDYSEDVRKTAELLSAARVAVYPVDARGVMSMPTFEASYKSSGNPAKGGNFARDNNRFMQKTANEHFTMGQIAEQTGGEDYANTNDLAAAVANAVENGSDYYTVGYVPAADKLNGEFHKIQVKLDGLSYKPAYRRGYYADSGSQSTGHDAAKPSMTAAAIEMGAPPATQILFQARVLAVNDPQLKGVKLPDGPAGAMAANLKGPVSQYAVEVMIDPHDIQFEETPEGTNRAAIELAAIAYDGDGKRVNYYDRGFTLNLKAEQYAHLKAGRIPALLTIDLPAGRVALRIVVVDRAAGRTGSLEVPMAVGAVKAGT